MSDLTPGRGGNAGEHHPNCYQRTGVPEGLPAGLCDCRVLRMIDAETPRTIPTAATLLADLAAARDDRTRDHEKRLRRMLGRGES